MAGYIGASGVSFSVTEADIKGDIKSTDASPEVTLQNTTEEDTDGGRESKITFKGEQSGGEITTLAQIQASHDGTADDEKGDLIFSTNDGADGNTPTERLRIDADGNVGIGTSSPSDLLELSGDTAQPAIRLTDADVSGLYHRIFTPTNTGLAISADSGNVAADSFLRFDIDSSERMRIDSSGNLLVGKTSTGIGTAGIQAEATGQLNVTKSGDAAIRAIRLSSDGDIVKFYKDTTAVGSIGNSGNYMYLASLGPSARGVKITDNFIPATTSGANNDNVMDLGGASVRWDDVYATNGTIQTSDRNEKQQIASLTDAEITAAKAISKLFKTFKWNDSVAEKGDAARTHSGVIAQDVEQAMTDAGLNAGDYAFFISSTWWETQTEVPAVEAVDAVYETVTIPAVLDDEGNEVEPETTEQRLVSEAVEAQEAYTRTDTYETAEEAPEGATERNRKGIRYPQLLSFIGAATEQRLASIESRLDALESA